MRYCVHNAHIQDTAVATLSSCHVHLDGTFSSLPSPARSKPVWSRSNEGSNGTGVGSPSGVSVYPRRCNLRRE